MIQLLIVDDEQIEREGMKAILRQSFPSLEMKEARNGNMAIEMAKKDKPDLILMDIKMPGITGLEALVMIKQVVPDTKFIMVTAYDTFDFMRQAIKLGASDYLLKPSKVSEIIETVGKAIKEIVMERKSRVTNELQQTMIQKTRAVIEADLVTQLLFEHKHEVHSNILVDILEIQTIQDMFVMNVLIPAGDEHLYSIVKEKFRQTGHSLVGALSGNQLPVIVFRNQEVSFRAQGTLLAREILSVKKMAGAGWYIGIGNVYPTLDDVKNSYQESLVATSDNQASSRFRFFTEVVVEADGFIEGKLKQLMTEIPDQVKLSQWEKVDAEIMNVIQLFENIGSNSLYVQQRILEVLLVVSRVLAELGVETGSLFYTSQTQDYRRLRIETTQLLEKMRSRYSEYYHRLELDTVEQIKKHIMEHSHKEISLDSLGRKMGLSPNYISKLFKEKMGINYIDFLTQCRIEKAKRLMHDPNRSIKEIAIEVGYHEPNYFSKVFKKIVHIPPKEYQNSIHGR